MLPRSTKLLRKLFRLLKTEQKQANDERNIINKKIVRVDIFLSMKAHFVEHELFVNNM